MGILTSIVLLLSFYCVRISFHCEVYPGEPYTCILCCKEEHVGSDWVKHRYWSLQPWSHNRNKFDLDTDCLHRSFSSSNPYLSRDCCFLFRRVVSLCSFMLSHNRLQAWELQSCLVFFMTIFHVCFMKHWQSLLEAVKFRKWLFHFELHGYQ